MDADVHMLNIIITRFGAGLIHNDVNFRKTCGKSSLVDLTSRGVEEQRWASDLIR